MGPLRMNRQPAYGEQCGRAEPEKALPRTWNATISGGPTGAHALRRADPTATGAAGRRRTCPICSQAAARLMFRRRALELPERGCRLGVLVRLCSPASGGASHGRRCALLCHEHPAVLGGTTRGHPLTVRVLHPGCGGAVPPGSTWARPLRQVYRERKGWLGDKRPARFAGAELGARCPGSWPKSANIVNEWRWIQLLSPDA